MAQRTARRPGRGEITNRKSPHASTAAKIVIALTALIEANALGLLGGYAPSPTRKFLDDHRQTIVAGFVLWAIYFALQLILSA